MRWWLVGFHLFKRDQFERTWKRGVSRQFQKMKGSYNINMIIKNKTKKPPNKHVFRAFFLWSDRVSSVTWTMSRSASFPREEILMSSPSNSTMAEEKNKEKKKTANNDHKMLTYRWVVTNERKNWLLWEAFWRNGLGQFRGKNPELGLICMCSFMFSSCLWFSFICLFDSLVSSHLPKMNWWL